MPCTAVTWGAVLQKLWQLDPPGTSALSTRPGLEPSPPLWSDWPLDWVASCGKQAPPYCHTGKEPGAQCFPSCTLASSKEKVSRLTCQPRGLGWGGPSVQGFHHCRGMCGVPTLTSISWYYQYLTWNREPSLTFYSQSFLIVKVMASYEFLTGSS